MMSPEVRRMLSGRAMEMQHRLLGRVLSVTKSKKSWRAGAWERIIEALNDEAQFVEECDAESTCTYVFLYEVAAMYLEQNHDLQRMAQLLLLTGAHMQKFAATAEDMHDGLYTAAQTEIIQLSLQGLRRIVVNLYSCYPEANQVMSAR